MIIGVIRAISTAHIEDVGKSLCDEYADLATFEFCDRVCDNCIAVYESSGVVSKEIFCRKAELVCRLGHRIQDSFAVLSVRSQSFCSNHAFVTNSDEIGMGSSDIDSDANVFLVFHLFST